MALRYQITHCLFPVPVRECVEINMFICSIVFKA